GATSLNDPLPQSLFVVDLSGDRARNVTDRQPFSCTRVEWLDDARVLLGMNLGANTSLEVFEPATRKRTIVVRGGPVISDWDVDPESGALAAVASTPHAPSELYVGSVEEKSVRRRTHLNPQLDELTLGRQDVVWWTGPGQFRIEGVVTYPTDYEPGRRYPTIVHPHGGPEGVSQNDFSTFAQLCAARGYVVLRPNYRGSGGYGVGFSTGDHNDLGGKEFEDILAGLRMLIDKGVADPEHVGMAGWSYGGYLSAMAATHYSDKFKAAVMGAGISNWVSFAGTTDIPHEMSLVHWNQWAYDDFAMYWERSPLSRIADSHTPTLILHGADDRRVHPGQALELYTALKRKGVPTQLVFYPRSGHGVGERAHRIDLYQRQLDWFDKYVR
ncbi:MAG: S9 family peptidase, partial [Planctomycetota bacterium]